MSKRKNNIDYYLSKIKMIEEEQRRKRRRIIMESSSDSDDNTSVRPDPALNDIPIDAPDETDPIPSAEASVPTQDPGNCSELDPELLTALGEETGVTPKFGEKIHHSLAQRWEPILKKGLPKEAKEKLLQQYLVPENCTLLQAPKLNNEVAAAISEASRHRDKRKDTEQQQLGVGITAINKALTSMLTSDNKIESIRIISDGCRILTDLHHQITQSRISVINYALAKPFLNIVQDSERDETLYGNKIGEKIKASKTIEKQSLSIKKFPKAQNNATTSEQVAPSTRPQYQYRQPGTYQGNWAGPPRFQQNRGGRRGTSRTSTHTSRRLPPRNQQAPNASSSSKPRAPATRQ